MMSFPGLNNRRKKGCENGTSNEEGNQIFFNLFMYLTAVLGLNTKTDCLFK